MSKRELTGIVLRKSGAKTIAVEVAQAARHSKYGKSMKRTKIYLVHDEKEVATVGQTVSIREARKLSARKRFVLVTE